MDEKIFLSFKSDGNSTEIPIIANRRIFAAEDILKTKYEIFADKKYSVEMHGIENINEFSFYLNGEKKQTLFENGKIIFLEEEICDGSIFSDFLGFVWISIEIKQASNDVKWLYSDLISVLVPENIDNTNYNSMLKYIYDNQGDLFYRKSNQVYSREIPDKESYDDFYSQLVLINKIINVYEESYGYFKANSRYKLEPVRVVDRANKIQSVDESMVSYIVQHPEYLRKESTGVRYGRQTFLPEKTSMIQNHYTRDIYENQVIVGFLYTMLRSVIDLQNQIKDFLDDISCYEYGSDGYIYSAYILYKNSINLLKEYSYQLEGYKKKLVTLLEMYKKSLDVEYLDVTSPPKPTGVFMNVPQYNRMFICILQWFTKSGYDLIKERKMMTFFDKYKVYEFYVLTRLINELKEMGFDLITANTTYYPKKEYWKYENQDCNNTFVFCNKDGQEISLFYEPLIYVDEQFTKSKLGLYRNNTVSLSNEKDIEKRGFYYTPDYVIKYFNGKRDSYMICDAKVSSKQTVRHKYVPDLSFKYIFSVSCTDIKDYFYGMTIFYEKSNDASLETFYDKQRGAIHPSVVLAPVSANLPEERQMEILKDLISAFLKE